MMKLKEISFEELENFALTTDEATFHQTKGWAKLKEHNGWCHYVVGLYDEDEIKAAALLLAKRVPIVKKYMFYSPRGFLIDYHDYNLLKEFTEEIKNIDDRLQELENNLKNNVLTIDDINLDSPSIYKDIDKIKRVKLNDKLLDKSSIWNNLSKEKQQELCMKYIETIDLGYDENRKVTIEKVNFRKSFLEEYSTLFTEGIVDKEVTVSYEDTTKVVSLSSPKNEKEIEDYIHKLQNYYQVEYFKIEVIRKENGTFYLEYSPNKKQEIIKLIPIKDEKGFKPNLGYGVIAVS